MRDTLFEDVTVITMDTLDPIRKNVFVHVSGGKVRYIGGEKPDPFVGDVLNARGKVLLPGLINCHTHVPMTVLRGYADDYDLQTWLFQHIFPVEEKLDSRCVRYSSLLGMAEMIAGGTTSFSDMYNFCDEILEGVKEAGLKANIARGILYMSEDFDFRTNPACSEMRELREKWHGRDHGRMRIDASLHGEYTSNPSVWEAVAEYARQHSLGMHVHLSETQKEHKECVQKYGMTPAAVLDHSGVWTPHSIAAHCVWITPEDMDILLERGVSPVHNPVSNLKLASGIAPVPDMLKKGLNVALGTDSVASNNSHDLFEEIKTAALIHKGISGDPRAVPAFEALKMATVNGARAQGRQEECGKIAQGMDADLILLDFDHPHLQPCHDEISNVVYSARAGDVALTMVRGKILYKNGEFLTIDMERVRREIDEYIRPRLFGR